LPSAALFGFGENRDYLVALVATLPTAARANNSDSFRTWNVAADAILSACFQAKNHKPPASPQTIPPVPPTRGRSLKFIGIHGLLKLKAWD